MKVKIILTNLIVVLLMGFATHVYLKSSLKSELYRASEEALKRDRPLFRDLLMLRGFELMAEVQRKASSKAAQAVFDPLPPDESEAEKELRKRSFLMVDKYAAEELKVDPTFERKPALVAITNPKGIVIARDTDANAHAGEMWGNKYNLVKFALNNRSKWDIIEYKGMFLQAASAPIVRDEGIVGCVIVGFEIDNGYMARERTSMGSDLGFIVKEKDAKQPKVYASSFKDDMQRKSLSGALVQEKERVGDALNENRESDLFPLEVQSQKFISAISPIPGNYQVGKIGFAVLRSLDTAFSPLGHLWFIVIFTGVGALLVILIGVLLGAHFIKPVEAMETEIRRVLEGDYNHRFEIKSAEVGGLSYLINQMLDVLTGEEEEEEEEESDIVPAPRERATTEEDFMREGEAGSGSDQDLLAEAEDRYFKRTFKEFCDLKTKIGEDPASIPFDQFVQKLKETESNILSTQQGSAVRFRVQLQANKISYKPIIIP
ncbi:MAG: hypothetical protein ABIJ56_09625 [Pseudomonadota bacterium]